MWVRAGQVAITCANCIGVESLGRQLRAMRTMRGLSQVELARRLHTSQSAVSRMEKTDQPSLRTVQRAARALRCRLQVQLLPVDRHRR